MNVGSRVQGLTRVHDVDVVVTAAVRGVVPDPRARCPPSSVKAPAEPLVTYALEGPAAAATPR